MVKTIQLTLYFEEHLKHHKRPLLEWMIECAQDLKLPGCTCLRSFMSFGSHQHIHSEGFFELQGKSIIQMVMILSQEQKVTFLNQLKKEEVHCFYTCMDVETGIL